MKTKGRARPNIKESPTSEKENQQDASEVTQSTQKDLHLQKKIMQKFASATATNQFTCNRIRRSLQHFL